MGKGKFGHDCEDLLMLAKESEMHPKTMGENFLERE